MSYCIRFPSKQWCRSAAQSSSIASWQNPACRNSTQGQREGGAVPSGPLWKAITCSSRRSFSSPEPIHSYSLRSEARPGSTHPCTLNVRKKPPGTRKAGPPTFSLSQPLSIQDSPMVSTSNSPGSASGAATPTNQKNGAAPLPADRKDALTVIQRDFRSERVTWRAACGLPSQVHMLIEVLLVTHDSSLSLGDTITIPDEEMLRLMATASVGDDVYKQDIKTNQLQDKIAKLAGKEAALFCPTGTMTNRELLLRATGPVQQRKAELSHTPQSWRSGLTSISLLTLSSATLVPMCIATRPAVLLSIRKLRPWP